MSRIAKVLAVTAAAGAVVSTAAGAAVADSGAKAKGVAAESPGIVSGNLVQVPIDIPINVCGNTVDVAALLNPAFGNHCVNR